MTGKRAKSKVAGPLALLSCVVFAVAVVVTPTVPAVMWASWLLAALALTAGLAHA